MIEGTAVEEAAEMASPAEWAEQQLAILPVAQACARLEHQLGVLPLLDALFEPQRSTLAFAPLRSGRLLGALGLTTPSPDLSIRAAALEGERSAGAVLLRGDVRLAHAGADGALVLVRLGGEYRLAWLDPAAPGVERRAARTAGTASPHGCWLHLSGTPVQEDLVSPPISVAPGSPLLRSLASYAAVWAHAALTCARQEIHALRRAARTTAHGGQAFNGAQWVALSLTEVEIEADLAAGATRRHLAHSAHGGEAGALAVAVAAARVVESVVRKSEELSRWTGWAAEDPEAGATRELLPFLGGALLLEAELGRAIGIVDPPEAEGAA